MAIEGMIPATAILNFRLNYFLVIMRQYKIDELRHGEIKEILSYFEQNMTKSPLKDTYWLELPDSVLTDLQASHKKCGPHVVGIIIEKDSIIAEFLVRTKKTLQCDCIQMGTFAQRNWIMETIDNILENLSIIG